MYKQFWLLFIGVLVYNLVLSQNAKCTLIFDASSIKDKKNVIIEIHKYRIDSGSYVLLKTININEDKLIFKLELNEPFSGFIHLKKNDTLYSEYSPLIFSNESINIAFEKGRAIVKSVQNNFVQENGLLFLAIPAIIYDDKNFSSKLIKSSYELSIPNALMPLGLRMNEYERNVLRDVNTHKKFYYTLECLDRIKRYLSPKTLDSCIKILRPYFGNTIFAKKIESYNEQSIKLMIGNQLLKFKVFDSIGFAISPDTIYSKCAYTLIDFWASWCSPCRKEISDMKILYPTIDTTKFQIISISIDENKHDWLQALTKDKMSWKNFIVSRSGRYSDVAKAFAIQTVPKNILVNQSGKIVMLDIFDDSLKAFLKDKNIMINRE